MWKRNSAPKIKRKSGEKSKTNGMGMGGNQKIAESEKMGFGDNITFTCKQVD